MTHVRTGAIGSTAGPCDWGGDILDSVVKFRIVGKLK